MTNPPAPDEPAVGEVAFVLDGHAVAVPDDGDTLLGALRDRLGVRSVKDGCSPQGQCGCCTVLIDGQPRVSCVTPVRRVAGRSVTTVDGLAGADRAAWADAMTSRGASQCGFCTPGIIMRLEGLRRRRRDASDDEVRRALAAHLCRCTGWHPIVDAWHAMAAGPSPPRRLDDAARRARLEGRAPQLVGPEVALGRAGFAADGPPEDHLVAVPDGDGGWVVGATLHEARRHAGKVQGRHTPVPAVPPIPVPEGDWALTLATSWVEPGYLETDASWCEPGGTPATPLANGGAFGAKRSSPAPAAARALADRHGRAVLVVLSREDAVRSGPKRPPLAAGIRSDGTGLVRVARTAGIAERIRAGGSGLEVEEVDIRGPATSSDLRAAGWAEAVVLTVAAGHVAGPVSVVHPEGATVHAELTGGRIRVRVDAGDPLDEVVLSSYCVGAAHQAYGWVTSEALSVDAEGVVHDLTVRSFGIVRATDLPPVDVEIVPGRGAPVNGSDAVFAAVAAATWIARGCPPTWPTG